MECVWLDEERVPLVAPITNLSSLSVKSILLIRSHSYFKSVLPIMSKKVNETMKDDNYSNEHQSCVNLIKRWAEGLDILGYHFESKRYPFWWCPLISVVMIILHFQRFLSLYLLFACHRTLEWHLSAFRALTSNNRWLLHLRLTWFLYTSPQAVQGWNRVELETLW